MGTNIGNRSHTTQDIGSIIPRHLKGHNGGSIPSKDIFAETYFNKLPKEEKGKPSITKDYIGILYDTLFINLNGQVKDNLLKILSTKNGIDTLCVIKDRFPETKNHIEKIERKGLSEIFGTKNPNTANNDLFKTLTLPEINTKLFEDTIWRIFLDQLSENDSATIEQHFQIKSYDDKNKKLILETSDKEAERHFKNRFESSLLKTGEQYLSGFNVEIKNKNISINADTHTNHIPNKESDKEIFKQHFSEEEIKYLFESPLKDQSGKLHTLITSPEGIKKFKAIVKKSSKKEDYIQRISTHYKLLKAILNKEGEIDMDYNNINYHLRDALMNPKNSKDFFEKTIWEGAKEKSNDIAKEFIKKGYVRIVKYDPKEVILTLSFHDKVAYNYFNENSGIPKILEKYLPELKCEPQEQKDSPSIKTIKKQIETTTPKTNIPCPVKMATDPNNTLGNLKGYNTQINILLTILENKKQNGYIYGPENSGKTHITQAIVKKLELEGENVIYTTGEEFYNKYQNAGKRQREININNPNNKDKFKYYNDFKDGFANVKLLIIDNIEKLSNKPGTQTMLNDIKNSGTQIIFSSGGKTNKIIRHKKISLPEGGSDKVRTTFSEFFNIAPIALKDIQCANSPETIRRKRDTFFSKKDLFTSGFSIDNNTKNNVIRLLSDKISPQRYDSIFFAIALNCTHKKPTTKEIYDAIQIEIDRPLSPNIEEITAAIINEFVDGNMINSMKEYGITINDFIYGKEEKELRRELEGKIDKLSDQRYVLAIIVFFIREYNSQKQISYNDIGMHFNNRKGLGSLYNDIKGILTNGDGLSLINKIKHKIEDYMKKKYSIDFDDMSEYM